VKIDVSLVDLQAVHGADHEVGPFCYEFAVDPYLHIPITPPDGVELQHLFVAVPFVALW